MGEGGHSGQPYKVMRSRVCPEKGSLVGGLGTFEGPIMGAILLFLIQDWFADLGVWYLIGLGTVVILFVLSCHEGCGASWMKALVIS